MACRDQRFDVADVRLLVLRGKHRVRRDLQPAVLGLGGVFLPMYQTEAMWLNFHSRYPMAIKVAAGFDAWDRSARSRCFVHILNSLQFLQVTGVEPPAKPPPARDYTEAGLPWFEHYGGDLTALDGAKKLAGLDSVAARKLKQGERVLADNDPVSPAVVQKVGVARVREGEF